MRRISSLPKFFWWTSVLSLLLLLTAWAAAQQGDDVTVTINSTERVGATGDAHVDATITFNPQRGYDRIKRLYTNLYVPFRDLGNARAY